MSFSEFCEIFLVSRPVIWAAAAKAEIATELRLLAKFLQGHKVLNSAFKFHQSIVHLEFMISLVKP